MKHFTAPAGDAKPKTIRMRLLAPHTHAGEPKAVGDEIDADIATADWLAANRIATAASNPTTPARTAQRRGTTGDDHEQ